MGPPFNRHATKESVCTLLFCQHHSFLSSFNRQPAKESAALNAQDRRDVWGALFQSPVRDQRHFHAQINQFVKEVCEDFQSPCREGVCLHIINGSGIRREESFQSQRREGAYSHGTCFSSSREWMIFQS